MLCRNGKRWLSIALLLALYCFCQAAFGEGSGIDADQLASFLHGLNAETFEAGLNSLLAQNGRDHIDNVYTTTVFREDANLNARNLQLHLSDLSESQAYPRLESVRTYLVNKMNVANNSALETLMTYVDVHLLDHFLTNQAGIDLSANELNLGTMQRAYRALLLGLNAVRVLFHNFRSTSSKLRLNYFSVLDPLEFQSFKGFKIAPNKSPNNNSTANPGSTTMGSSLPSSNIPDAVDWTTKNAVGPVRNQGTCGSCWTFAAVAVLEGRLVASGKGNLTDLSEQQLLSCIIQNGCAGGNYETAWSYTQNHGVVSSNTYPYNNGGTKTAATCVASETQQPIAMATPFPWQSAGLTTEQQMMEAVATGGPIAIAIATPGCFSSYSSGVLTSADCDCYSGKSSIDHAVTIVGYGTTPDGIKFWKVRNSWGSTWGMSGYVLLEREANTDMGMCGLLTDPNYPKSVDLSPACNTTTPSLYCAGGLQVMMYTNINETTGEPLNSCVASLSGQYSDNTCTSASSLPVWAWVLISVGIVIGCVLLMLLVKFSCERYAPSNAWYNVFSKPEQEGYRLLSKDEEAIGQASSPNADLRSIGGSNAPNQPGTTLAGT